MLQCELWATQSTTVAWHTCFTLSCIGTLWQIESHTSLRCDGVQVRAWPGTGLPVWAMYSKTAVIVFKCLHRQVPLYLTELCRPISSDAGHIIFVLHSLVGWSFHVRKQATLWPTQHRIHRASFFFVCQTLTVSEVKHQICTNDNSAVHYYYK